MIQPLKNSTNLLTLAAATPTPQQTVDSSQKSKFIPNNAGLTWEPNTGFAQARIIFNFTVPEINKFTLSPQEALKAFRAYFAGKSLETYGDLNISAFNLVYAYDKAGGPSLGSWEAHFFDERLSPDLTTPNLILKDTQALVFIKNWVAYDECTTMISQNLQNISTRFIGADDQRKEVSLKILYDYKSASRSPIYQLEISPFNKNTSKTILTAENNSVWHRYKNWAYMSKFHFMPEEFKNPDDIVALFETIMKDFNNCIPANIKSLFNSPVLKNKEDKTNYAQYCLNLLLRSFDFYQALVNTSAYAHLKNKDFIKRWQIEYLDKEVRESYARREAAQLNSYRFDKRIDSNETHYLSFSKTEILHQEALIRAVLERFYPDKCPLALSFFAEDTPDGFENIVKRLYADKIIPLDSARKDQETILDMLLKHKPSQAAAHCQDTKAALADVLNSLKAYSVKIMSCPDKLNTVPAFFSNSN